MFWISGSVDAVELRGTQVDGCIYTGQKMILQEVALFRVVQSRDLNLMDQSRPCLAYERA